MKLLHPTARMILQREPIQQRRLVLEQLGLRGRVPAARLVEDSRRLGVAARLGVNRLEPVIRLATALGVKERVTRVECGPERLVAGDGDIGRSLERVDPGIEGRQVFERERAVWAPG